MAAAALPSGTVTFLFTDIEGSTRLLEELGTERYADLLVEHHRLCREAWAAHGGVEVDTAGDAFFVAFARPDDALRACAAAHEGLASTPLRVRIGVHTGEVLVGPTGYVGFEVHRAARIAASAHGGQVVVSSSTAALIGAGDDQVHGLVDLGDHRFKDLAAPERVFQLGEGDFPPLKSLYRVTLPVPATPLVGRARELGEVLELLGRPAARLVSLTGPGGTGKTRLALQAAAEASDGFLDGVFWVGLASLRDSALVASTVAQVLGLKEEPGREPLEVVCEHLAGKRLLLLLDNAEHLLPHLAGTLARLLAVGGPSFLVTSRERLQIAGEHTYAVPELEQFDAVELLRTRAASAGVQLEATTAVQALCARLEQLPLALELAAARTVVFTPEQLLERLGQRLDLLKGGRDADPRQRTLRATVEWSYDLLSETEQRLLRGLSVFAGGCTYDAAEAVCDADPDTLQSLIDKSLLRRRDTELGPRYWMLETIREYAATQLAEPSEAPESRGRLVRWVAEEVSGFLEESNLALARDSEWYSAFAAEIANVRAALAWAEHERNAEAMGRLATCLFIHAFVRGGLPESRDALEAALRLDPPPTSRLEVLRSLSNAASRLGDGDRALEVALEEVEIARTLGTDPALVFALRDLGNAYLNQLDEPRATLAYEESSTIARSIGDRDGEVGAVVNLGALALAAGRWQDALDLTRTAAALNETIGDWETNATTLYNEAVALWQLDLPDDPRPLLEDAMMLAVDRDWLEGLLYPFELIGALDIDRGYVERGAILLGVGERLRRESQIGDYDAMHAAFVEAAHENAATAVGAERFTALLRRGAALELTDALSLALGETSPV